MKVTSDAIEGSRENFETMGNIVDNLDEFIKNITNEVGTLRTEFDNISTKAQSIDDIAGELGFAESSAFHRDFKKWTGIRPGEYRYSVER